MGMTHDIDANQARAPPRLLYTGTCLNYMYGQIAQYGEFRHDGKPVCFYGEPTGPRGLAIERARQYHDHPALLIVDTDKLAHTLEWDGYWLASAVNLESMLPCEIDPLGLTVEKKYEKRSAEDTERAQLVEDLIATGYKAEALDWEYKGRCLAGLGGEDIKRINMRLVHLRQ